MTQGSTRLFGPSGEAWFVVNPAGTLLELNEAAAGLLGLGLPESGSGMRRERKNARPQEGRAFFLIPGSGRGGGRRGGPGSRRR